MQGKEGCPKEEFYRLVNQYQTRLMRMCYMLLKNRQYAEDATQETFLKAFLHYGTLRDKSKEKAWLMAIAINTCRMMLRSRWIKHIQRSLPDPEEERAFQPFPMDEIMLHIEVERLPYRQREAVLLYYYQGMSTGEVARCLNVSQSLVSSRLKRARKQLKNALNGGETHE